MPGQSAPFGQNPTLAAAAGFAFALGFALALALALAFASGVELDAMAAWRSAFECEYLHLSNRRQS